MKTKIRMIKDNKITKGLKIVLTIGVLIFFQQFVKAQENQNHQFLQKVGVLDSLYSKILNESRKIYIQLPASYSPEKNQKYPVVFILDGEIFLPTVNDVQNYYSGGFTPPPLAQACGEGNELKPACASLFPTTNHPVFLIRDSRIAN